MTPMERGANLLSEARREIAAQQELRGPSSHIRDISARQKRAEPTGMIVCLDLAFGTNEAVLMLANATQRDQDSSEAFEYLSMAYHRKGDTPKAQLAAAQGLFVAGKYVEARTQASRAQAQFKEGSPGWLKADDILNYRPPKAEGIFD